MTRFDGAIGQKVNALDTPALLVDLDVMEENIARITDVCRTHKVNWRPHSKGHKTPEIALKQIAAGAIGVTCAKVSEAEVMAGAGIRDILIANQIVGESKVNRLIALADRADPIVGVDSIANLGPIAAAAHAAGKQIRVAIEVNIGMNCAGVLPGQPVLEFANIVARTAGARLAGMFGWESHAVLIADPAEKRRVVADAVARLTDSARLCREAGHTIDVVSCGGTGTFPYCIQQPGVTEVQVGGAIFCDMHYRKDYHFDFPFALTVLASVTSRPTPTRVILDAGRKTMSCDAAAPEPIGLPAVEATRFSAEHTKIELLQPSDTPRVGERVQLVVGYSDTTVHLHEQIIGVRNGRVESVWRVAGRGMIY